MKKTIKLGTVKVPHRDNKLCPVEIEVSLEGGRLSIVGNVWMPSRRDIYSGGQNYEEIAELFPNNPTVQRLVEVWQRWHLNDMKPTCEHQRALGWEEKAKEQVTLYHWNLKSEALRQHQQVEKDAMRRLLAGETVTLTEAERFLGGLKFSISTWTVSPAPELVDLYEQQKPTTYSRPSETKTLGWVSATEHPEGLLSRPCPVCGYKYGTAWKTEPLPAEIIAEVESWTNETFAPVTA